MRTTRVRYFLLCLATEMSFPSDVTRSRKLVPAALADCTASRRFRPARRLSISVPASGFLRPVGVPPVKSRHPLSSGPVVCPRDCLRPSKYLLKLLGQPLDEPAYPGRVHRRHIEVLGPLVGRDHLPDLITPDVRDDGLD